MRTRSSFAAICATALMLGTVPAIGADLPPPPPPYVPDLPPPPAYDPPPPAGDPSCVYLRGDLGIAVHERPKITKSASTATNPRIAETIAVDVGAGCKLSKYFRTDVTVGYRDGAGMSEHFNDLDADLSVVTGLLNGYVDFGDFNGVKPYIGAGVGVAYHMIDNVRFPAGATDGDSVDFAWAFHLGTAVELNDRWALDFSYRYIDLGVAKSGGSTFRVDDLVAHDFRVGLRWKFASY